jgi:hypothetical protein
MDVVIYISSPQCYPYIYFLRSPYLIIIQRVPWPLECAYSGGGCPGCRGCLRCPGCCHTKWAPTTPLTPWPPGPNPLLFPGVHSPGLPNAPTGGAVAPREGGQIGVGTPVTARGQKWFSPPGGTLRRPPLVVGGYLGPYSVPKVAGVSKVPGWYASGQPVGLGEKKMWEEINQLAAVWFASWRVRFASWRGKFVRGKFDRKFLSQKLP